MPGLYSPKPSEPTRVRVGEKGLGSDRAAQQQSAKAPESPIFVPVCRRCAAKSWVYGIKKGTARTPEKQCAECGVPWPDQREEEIGELEVPDPALVLDYTQPRRAM